MSNHAFQPGQAKPPKHKDAFVAAKIALCFLFAFLFAYYLSKMKGPAQNYSAGHILETRVSVVGTRESNRGSYVYYRGEARVSYSANGKDYVEWLPATKTMNDREWLSFELSRRVDDEAEVRWNKSDPTMGTVVLHLK